MTPVAACALTFCRGQVANASARREVSPGYGLGFAHFPLPGRPEAVIGHDGSNTMWYAFLLLVPERDLAIVMATNDGRSIAAQRAAMAIAPWVLDHAP